MSLPQDILGVIRGLQSVFMAGIKLQESSSRIIWNNSSVRAAVEDIFLNVKPSAPLKINKETANISSLINESSNRLFTVIDGVKQYATLPPKSEGVKEQQLPKKTTGPQNKTKSQLPPNIRHSDLEIKLTPSDKELLKKLDMEHRQKMKADATASVMAKTKTEPEKTKTEHRETKPVDSKSFAKDEPNENSSKEKRKIVAVPNPRSRQMLSSNAKERTVPSSRLARMLSFGSLAAGLGVGTAAEFIRRSVSKGERPESASALLLTEANMNRIVDTLCKVRGAALKIGQMLSIQDESIINPEFAKALERVRKSADFMPSWQVAQVLQTEIGPNWRELLSEFEEKPFAAASIGQVHWGRMKDGREVAIKLQYPGVARGIESDIDNLVGIMNVWNIFPKGMFVDNVAAVAKRELAWEVDYKREAECTKKFRELIKPYPDYYVPRVIDDLCGAQVFTTEYIEGIPVDQCMNMDLEDRKFIANKIMELCLLELMEFRYMQTDPNWANFFYNKKKKQIILLDFGATREYSKDFVDKYICIIKAATQNDRQKVLNISRDLGFLTGYESKVMEEAHVDAVMILSEVFQTPNEFNFKGQDTVMRIQNLVPTLLTHRLCPPPEEIYSLHRKLSGVFMLCAKLNAPVTVRSRFFDMYNKHKFN